MIIEQKSEKIYKSRKMKIDFNSEQEIIANKQVGMYRYVYNWALEKENLQYELYKSDPTVKSFLQFEELCRLYTSDKNTREDMSFLNNDRCYTVGIARMAIKDLIHAFESYFNGNNHHPEFKRKRGRKPSPMIVKYRKEKTYISNGKVRLEGFKPGEMININTNKFDEIGFNSGYGTPRENGEWACPTIKFNKDYWTLNFIYPSDRHKLETLKSRAIGIDLNVHPTFMTSDNEVFQQPNTSKYDKKLKRINRKMQKGYIKRKQKAMISRTKISNIPLTKNELKLHAKFRKYHRRKTNIKNNFYHEITKSIVKRNPECICIEKFRVSNLCKEKPYMWKRMVNTSFYKISEMFKANCNKYGVPLIEADPHYPSSKICSNCGNINNKIGNKKIFKCPKCGIIINRDLNAAKNLQSLWYNRFDDSMEFKHKIWRNN